MARHRMAPKSTPAGRRVGTGIGSFGKRDAEARKQAALRASAAEALAEEGLDINRLPRSFRVSHWAWAVAEEFITPQPALVIRQRDGVVLVAMEPAKAA